MLRVSDVKVHFEVPFVGGSALLLLYSVHTFK